MLRFVARSIVARTGVAVLPEAEAAGSDPLEQRAATLIRTPPLLCHGSEPIREAATRMTAEGASAVPVPVPVPKPGSGS